MENTATLETNDFKSKTEVKAINNSKRQAGIITDWELLPEIKQECNTSSKMYNHAIRSDFMFFEYFY